MTVQSLPPVPNTPLVNDPQSDAIWKRWLSIAYTRITGALTSVGLSLPSSIFTVTGSPVTSSGTLTGSLKVQNANKVFAGPTTGADAAPTFRALVAADMPAGAPVNASIYAFASAHG